GRRPSVVYSSFLFNPAIAMAVMLPALEGERLVGLAGKKALPARRLHDNIGRGSAAIGLSRRNRSFDTEHLVDAAVDTLVDGLEILDGQTLKAAILGFRQRHDLPGDVVRVAERNAE